MTFTLTIKCDNAAFHEDDGEATSGALGAEIARILRTLGGRLEQGADAEDSGYLFDGNGNKVGGWRIQL